MAFALILLLALLLPAPASMSQSEGIVPRVEAGKRIYTVDQFARFAPQTAADLVGQIPGFSLSSVSSDRGLGEASQNVLINGQRITGKNNDAMTVLGRIPVSAVRRLEVVDGAMLNISGFSGHVLNVITDQGSVQGNFVWRPVFRKQVGTFWPGGELNASGKSALGDFTAGVRWDGFRGGGWGGETEAHPATDLSFFRDQDRRYAYDAPKLSASFNHIGASGSIWNFNGSTDREHNRRRIITRYQQPGDPATLEDSRGTNIQHATEIGSDYEFAVGDGRLKLIGFYSDRHGPSVSTLTSLADGDTVPTGSRFSQDSTQGERVGRGEYRWKALGADWTLSGEAAYNFIDATGTLEELDDVGMYQPVDLLGASSRVAEHRGESILSFSRPIGSGWSLQLSGGAEYSRLQQDGAAGQTRHFWRPKGAVSLAWNPPSPWEMNFKLQRKVGQLNFFDFLASVDLDTSNANGGNPELVPPQSWLLQWELIRSLGAAGKLRFFIEGEQIQDLVEQIPLSPTAEAPGNIPRARKMDASLTSTLLLDGIGLRGGKLDSLLVWGTSHVRDPLTGESRHLNGNCCYWNTELRYDMPGTPLTFGLYSENASPNHFYRLDYQSRSWSSRPYGSIYFEHKNLLGMKLRAEIGNLYKARDRSRSVSYVARRDGPVDYTRDYGLSYGWIYRLQVSGTF
jgi:outer membrane receptor for ferrienterochelin and colicins